MAASEAPPRALRLREGNGLLEVEWDGMTARLPARLLRERCPCAGCRRSRRDRAPFAGTPVEIVATEPYGPNAVNLRFSDGHGRGIYPFSYLKELGQEVGCA